MVGLDGLRGTMATLAFIALGICYLLPAAGKGQVVPKPVVMSENFSKPERLADQPVLQPRPGFPDSAGAFNPSVVKVSGNEYVMLYRMQDNKGVSSIGYASSKDGVHFIAEDKPVLFPTRPDERMGIEDPRVHLSMIEPGAYDMTATVYDGKDAQLALFRSRDLRSWQRISIDWKPGKNGTWNINWTKSGAIVPKKINGKYWMYYLGDTPGEVPATEPGGLPRPGDLPVRNEMGLACSEDGILWKDATQKPVLPGRAGKFDSRVVEPGPAPIITRDGIMLLYNGADDRLAYRTGWVLFDKTDPARVIARCDQPIFEPELSWEKKVASDKIFQAANVVFVEGMVPEADHYKIYYGAADSRVGVAKIKLVPSDRRK